MLFQKSNSNQLNTGVSILFRINSDDRIIFINDDWSKANALNNSCGILAGKTLHQNFWDFFDDIGMEYLYRKLLFRVRRGHKIKFNLRCDYADSTKLLELHITLQNRNEVLFEVRVTGKDFHTPQNNSDESSAQTEELLVVCSWCDRINIKNNNWQEIEQAVNTLKLFESQNLPLISHGMCSDCYNLNIQKTHR